MEDGKSQIGCDGAHQLAVAGPPEAEVAGGAPILTESGPQSLGRTGSEQRRRLHLVGEAAVSHPPDLDHTPQGREQRAIDS